MIDWKIRYGTGFSLGAVQRNMLAKVSRAMAVATDRASTGARDDIRRAMRSQRLGGLANVVKQTSDLKKRRLHLRGDGGIAASGVIYAVAQSPRTKGALQAYVNQEVTRITPVKGKYLWIATPEIPQRAGRFRMTPEFWNKFGFARKIGPLKFIVSRRGQALLVVDNISINPLRPRSARRLPKSGRTRGGRAHVGIVAFVGIRWTQRHQRVNPRSLAQEWQDRIPRFIFDAMR